MTIFSLSDNEFDSKTTQELKDIASTPSRIFPHRGRALAALGRRTAMDTNLIPWVSSAIQSHPNQMKKALGFSIAYFGVVGMLQADSDQSRAVALDTLSV